LSFFYSAFQLRQIAAIVKPFFSTWDDALFTDYCKRFQLKPDAKVKALSTGQSKLFSLVVALSHRPKLLILDEPTSNLDPIIRNDILELFGEIMLDGETTIFYSTHITSDLDKTADYIMYLHDGQIRFHEEKDVLLEKYRVIKGDNSLLAALPSLRLYGVKQTDLGFTALCKIEDLPKLGERIVAEKPDIEKIMLYAAKEDLE
ncbi:AAA family ATPase, partial [Ruminococcaceae bacterium OttesenSCG-928-L11]|nr:AAA family ATPase [Ruminococcaceae bacterium OttesenSCG-928-L11]